MRRGGGTRLYRKLTTLASVPAVERGINNSSGYGLEPDVVAKKMYKKDGVLAAVATLISASQPCTEISN